MSKRRVSVAGGMIVTCLAATLGFWAGSDVGPGRAQTSPEARSPPRRRIGRPRRTPATRI